MQRSLLTRRQFVAGPAALVLFGGSFLLTTGCSTPLARSQAEEETDAPYEVRTVGDVGNYATTRPLAIGGVGLVTHLEGTGGEAPNDSYRQMLEGDLRKRGVPNIKQLLSSRECALVHLQAYIPPGARKGDPVDIEVSLPQGSKATSLRGGFLQDVYLYDYESSRNLSANFRGPDSLHIGHPLVRAKGQVIVGLGREGEGFREQRGRVWGGGKCATDNPYLLGMKPGNEFMKVTAPTAERICQTFHGTLKNPDGSSAPVASATGPQGVALRVPPAYRHNHPRYLRVVRLIPLREDVDVPTARGKTYRQRLGEELMDPAKTVTAALRLEAMGPGSAETLKKGLRSQHALVRFCSAESLAYLGNSACADVLADCVRTQPALRAFALSAMASAEEGPCQRALAEILQSSDDDETRYGAFRALRSLDERDPAVAGELLNDSFWLHRVAAQAAPLVHVSSSRRPEVVVFGEGPALVPPFNILAGEFTLTAVRGDSHCTISRVVTRSPGEPIRKQCGLDLGSVIHKMADMGALYPEVVEMLQQAHGIDRLSCRVRVDALPQATSVYDLVELGKGGKKEGGAEIDLGATPTLYEKDPAGGPVSQR